MAELSIDVAEKLELSSDDDDTKGIKIGQWYLVEGKLVQAPDPRVDGLPPNHELTAEQFLRALMSIARGNAIDTTDWQEEKLDETFAIKDLRL